MVQKERFNQQKIILSTDQFVKDHIPSSRLNKHGSPVVYFRHVLGVRKYALLLAEKYGADKFVVEMAALLHDVGADVGETHAQESARIAKKFLSTVNLDEKIKPKIISCIVTHSMGSVAETQEQQIIQDADGLIFIDDSFKEYFEKKKQKLPLEVARKESIEKTKKMMGKIKTEEGRKLAQKFLKTAIDYLTSAN